jgi:hypothetical protein
MYFVEYDEICSVPYQQSFDEEVRFPLDSNLQRTSSSMKVSSRIQDGLLSQNANGVLRGNSHGRIVTS